ncbi:hypothetical protein B566_EDAN010451 [Ephemera danica]|nr:hypothetical protein B566_EDAN010451 [Ephemera danica]
MADPELEEIRARRMAQLRGDSGQKDGGAAMEERKRQQEEMKNGMLSQILDQSARARLNTLLVAKPEKARAVEGLLISMAQRGQIQGRLGEKELIGILEQVGASASSKSTVKFDRRRAALDSDEDDL